MPRSVFKKSDKIEVIDSMIDYVTFIKNIAINEDIPNVVLSLSTALKELEAEKVMRIKNDVPDLCA